VRSPVAFIFSFCAGHGLAAGCDVVPEARRLFGNATKQPYELMGKCGYYRVSDKVC
jgi:hypothetical protein